MDRVNGTIGASLLSGLTVFVLLLPWSGNDSDPPECASVFGYVVPCGLGPDQAHGQGFATVGALVAIGLVLLGSALGRRAVRTDRRDRGG